jgi:thiol-disulfide isomerase/thioredoxin
MPRILLSPIVFLGLLTLVWADDSPTEKKPSADGGRYLALMAEHRKTLKEADTRFDRVGTDEERRAIRAEFHKWRVPFLDRVLAFAETNPRDRDTFIALFFALHPDNYPEERQVGKVIELILKDHATSDRLTDPPLLQAVGDSPSAERLMRVVLEKNPHRPVQAQACLRLGQIIKRKVQGALPKEAARLTREAEGVFERVTAKYSDIKREAGQAGAELFELRYLAVGKLLPDIKGKDSDDKELKLSDYRGKVVVVSFWADWCVPCMKMVPHEQSLVKRMRGKPFALVGVNRNISRESLKKCEEKHDIRWRSFFDGLEGPICTGHNIQRMPTIYVLDAKGVIRHMNVRGEELDRAVDQLLAEPDERTGK